MNYEEKIASYKEEIIEKVAIWEKLIGQGAKAISSGLGKKVISGAGVGAVGSNLTYDPNNSSGESRMSHMLGGAITGGVLGGGLHYAQRANLGSNIKSVFGKSKPVAATATKATTSTAANVANDVTKLKTPGTVPMSEVQKTFPDTTKKFSRIGPEAKGTGNPTSVSREEIQRVFPDQTKKFQPIKDAEEYNEFIEKLAMEIIEQAHLEKTAGIKKIYTRPKKIIKDYVGYLNGSKLKRAEKIKNKYLNKANNLPPLRYNDHSGKLKSDRAIKRLGKAVDTKNMVLLNGLKVKDNTVGIGAMLAGTGIGATILHKKKKNKGIDKTAQEQNLNAFKARVNTDNATRPDSNYNEKQLDEGVKVEHEHTNDTPMAKTIAKDHLDEIRDYYTRLKKMESKAKK